MHDNREGIDLGPEPGREQLLRIAVLAANYLSSFSIGVAIGGIIPFLSLIMEQRGVGEVVIGANTAAGSLGIICVAPFVPAIVRRFGLGVAVIGGIVASSVAFLLMGVFQSMLAWFPLRLIFAGGLAIHWIVSETWMNAVASARNRGRIMSVYVTLIAAGFATGPVILGFVGAGGWAPFLIFAAGMMFSALPLALVIRFAPRLPGDRHGTPLYLARSAPTIFAAVVTTGISCAVCFTFLPIYGIRVGLTGGDAVFLLTVFLAGNLVFQIPLGWLADRVNPRFLLLACAAMAIAAPPLVPMLLNATVPLTVLLALWGGALFGLYTVGVIMLGARFQGRGLVVANAAYVMSFEGASILGPPIAGWAMSVWTPNGMMMFLVVVAAVFAAVILVRGTR